MKHKYILLSVFIIGIFLAVQIYAEGPQYKNIKYEEVFGELIQRDKSDRVYSGQIKSAKGLEEFLEQYPVSLNFKDVDFNKQMLIFGITDQISTRAFQLLSTWNNRHLLLDYYDTDIKYKLAITKEGERYSFLQIFLLQRIDGLAHVNVKNKVEDKLSWIYK